jgi:site-specific recombinase XerD
MLYPYSNPFLDYFKLADFSNRSFQAMASRINEFQHYLQTRKIKSIKKVAYRHLVEFAGDFQNPSIHVTKSRVWMLREFYHYLSLQGHVPENIAIRLPYPKIEKTVPDFLTQDELNRLIKHSAGQALDLIGLRNLVIILLLGFLGIRTSALIGINIENVVLVSGLLWVYEKGRWRHTLMLP